MHIASGTEEGAPGMERAMFSGISGLLSKFFAEDGGNTVTEEDLISIIDTLEDEGVLDPEQMELVNSAMEFRDKLARDIMIPMEEVMTISSATSMAEIAEIVKPCGLFRTKAKSIKEACTVLCRDYGGRVPDTMEELLTFPGVGRKIANLLLGDIFGKPAVVVDTHCIRLSNRMGLVDGLKDPTKIEKILRELIDLKEGSDFCHRIVLFGREVCTARKPKCEECPLAIHCREVNMG